MKLESKIKVDIKGKVFGGSKLLACIPLISKDEKSLVLDAKETCKFDPDIIEWRADYLTGLENPDTAVSAARALHDAVGNAPILFTPRHHEEGGVCELSDDKKMTIIKAVAENRLVDIVDIEMRYDRSYIDKIRSITKKNDVKLVCSYHNFKETPEEKFILEKLMEGEDLGADIVKIAIMPQNFGDVVHFINAVRKARIELVNIPIIAGSMGELGIITRIAGGFFGSDMSFAAATGISGPGQVNIKDFNMVKELLENARKVVNI